jgi:carbonic anhydrase
VEPVPTPYNQGAILMSDMINDMLDGNSSFIEGVFLPNENSDHAIAAKQRPKVLWIGCSDSRVSEHQMTGSKPGTMFVHRHRGSPGSTAGCIASRPGRSTS